MKSEPQGSKATERSITRMLSKLIKHEQPLSSWREQSFSETPPIVELTRKQAQQNNKKDDSSMTKTQTLSASSHRSSVCSSSENTKSHKVGEKGKLKSAKKIQHKGDVVDSNKKTSVPVAGACRKVEQKIKRPQLSQDEELLTAKKSNSEMIVQPSDLLWKPVMQMQHIQLTNPSNQRVAVKVKCSNNSIYSVDPVYSFIGPGCSVPVKIVRCIGARTADKLVFVTAVAKDDAKDARTFFESVCVPPKSPITHSKEREQEEVLAV